MAERLERLLNLTAALLTAERPLTAAELARRVPGFPEPAAGKEAFHRAFERDKAALREMGVPLQVAEVPGTDPPEQGYVIEPEDYALRDPGLDPDEVAALQLALAAVRLEGVTATEALWKIGGSVASLDSTPQVAALPTLRQLPALFGAVASRASVTFHHRGVERHVDPYRLSFSRGHWYLDGYDHDRADLRQFRVDRMEGDVEVGPAATFERPVLAPEESRPSWEIGGGEPVVARLLVDAGQAEWALAAVPEADRATARRRPDGSVELEVTVTNPDGFRSFVLGFLDHAEVLEPEELRVDVVRWLRQLATVD